MILSIIIPMFNVENYIERCLISTQQQNIPVDDYEIIVVNDGCSDNSLDIAKKIAEKYSNIRIISRVNRGPSAARNTGMQNSSGDFYFFLDADDWIQTNCLYAIVQKLKIERPDILYIGYARTDGINILYEDIRRGIDCISGPESLRLGISDAAAFSIVSAKFMADHQFTFYEGIFHEDAELVPRMHYTAQKISFVNTVCYFYYANPASTTNRIFPKKSFDLINVVCNSLAAFADNNVAEKDKREYYSLISMYFNNALNEILHCDKLSQKLLSECCYQHKQYVRYLIKANKPKFKIEGFLLMLFPHKSVSVYKTLSMLKRH